MEMKRSQKGQSLVETGLILPIVLVVMLVVPDLVLLIFNHGLAFYYAFRAAREASMFIADGTHTCDQMARSAAFGSLGKPVFMMVDIDDSTKWSLDITPCPDDPSWSSSSGVDVKATLTFEEDVMGILHGPFHGSIFHIDTFQ